MGVAPAKIIFMVTFSFEVARVDSTSLQLSRIKKVNKKVKEKKLKIYNV